MRDLRVDTRRANSSETSIDADTANHLLVNNGASPLQSGTRGARSYANPTAFAFYSYPQSHSLNSSQSPQQRVRTPDTSYSHRSSGKDSEQVYTSTHGMDAPRWTAPFVHHDSTVDLILDAYENNGPLPHALSTSEKRGARSQPKKSKTRRGTIIIFLLLAFVLAAAGAMIPVGFLVLKPMFDKSSPNKASTANDNISNNTSNSTSTATSNPTIANSPNNTSSTPDDHDPATLGIPPSANGTVLDSTKWLDWTDFNLTYTNATVGGLSIMVRSHL